VVAVTCKSTDEEYRENFLDEAQVLTYLSHVEDSGLIDSLRVVLHETEFQFFCVEAKVKKD